VMHIPQGMAYGMLAGVEPVVGIYTAFSPVLIYTILGTMPHVSMGTFAVVSILVSKPVLRLGGDPEDIDGEEVVVGGEENFTRLQVATAVTLGVGIIQTCLGLFRLGSFSILLTDCLVSAFSVGASFHVFTSQLKHLLGISIPTISGPGRLIFTYNALGLHLVDVNLVSLAISVVSILLLVLSDQAVAPRLKGICNFPLPSQLIVVSLATLLSHSLQLSEVHNVRTIGDIGDIPTGLPYPTSPPLSMLSQVLPECLPIAVVAFSIGQGLGNLFGSKHGYKVPPNQELLAQGVSNLLGSFMSCLPMSGSLSRSLVQESSGCKSLLTGLTSAIFLLGVLLFLGPIFQPLPICVLAAIIVSSLTGMFKKLTDLTKYWEKGSGDGLLWLFTFLTTVFVDVDLGLVVGIVLSLLLTLARGFSPSVIYQRSSNVLYVKGPLNYLTLGFTKLLVEARLRHICKSFTGQRNTSVKLEEGEGEGEVPRSEDELLAEEEEREALVLDLSGLTHLDKDGAGLVSWLEVYLKENSGPQLGAIVLSSSMQPLLSSSSLPLFTSLQRARMGLEQKQVGRQQVL